MLLLHVVVIQLSNVIGCINEFSQCQCQTQIVLKWVTISRQVNHLSM